MSDIFKSNSSDIALNGDLDGLKIEDGILVDGLDIYTVNSSSLGLSSDDEETASEETNSEIEFDQVLCLTGEFYYQTSSAITFTSDTAVLRPGPPGSGINDPPTGFVFNVVKKRKSFNDIVFNHSLTVIGGYILDDSCNPTKLIPNFEGWGTLTDGGWSDLTDLEWDMLGG